MDFSTIKHFAPEEECVMNLQCMQDEASEIDRKSHLPKKKKKEDRKSHWTTGVFLPNRFILQTRLDRIDLILLHSKQSHNNTKMLIKNLRV